MKFTHFYKDRDGYLLTDTYDCLKGLKGLCWGNYFHDELMNLYLFKGDKPTTWIVDVKSGNMRQIVDENSHLSGFSDADIDWDADVVCRFKSNVQARYIAKNTIEKEDYRIKEKCLLLRWCIFFEDGYASMDSDGFGMEPDEIENLYMLMDENLQPLSKWTTLEKIFNELK